MKKLLLVNSYYFPDIKGGAEVSTQLLAEGFTNHYEVFVLTTGGQKREIIKEVVNGVKVYRIPSNNLYWPKNSTKRNTFSKVAWHFINHYNPLQNSYIKKVISEISPDIIHTQNLMGIGTYLWRITKKLKIPVVHTIRDYALFEPVTNTYINRYLGSRNKMRSENVDYVVGVSNFILENHLKKGYFQNSPHCSIHNIVLADKYPRRYRQDGEPLIIGYYGQLEMNKGISILIKSIKELPVSIIGQVIICGTGSEEDELKKLIGNDDRFIFKGKLPIKDVYKTMAMTDLTVVPSVWEEPFGRVIIESYMQGTPVIASKTGGIPEIIKEDEYIFQVNDIKELQEKMNKFYGFKEPKINQEIIKAYSYAEKYADNISEYQTVYNYVNSKKQ